MIMTFQSVFASSSGTCLVTLLSTSVKSYSEVSALVHHTMYIVLLYAPMRQIRSTDRNKEAGGAIEAAEGVWEEFEPGIVAIHDELAICFCFHLCEPCILVC